LVHRNRRLRHHFDIEDLPNFEATPKDIKALAGPCSESLDFALNSAD
jgi:hypothetical protein